MNSQSRLRTLWEYVSSSLWALPSLLLLLSLPATLGVLSLDRPGYHEARFLIYRGTPAEAMGISSTLLTGMITMTSLVFSITIVVLTLAASNYGPRLVRSFMSNWYTQLVLGVYVSTITVCIVTLFAMGSRRSDIQSVMPSVSFEIGLTLTSVLLLVFFLHNLGRSIIAENLIERVGAELDRQIESFPHRNADRCARYAAGTRNGYSQSVSFGLRDSGYVTAVDIDKLVGIAEAQDVLVELRFRPGDYLLAEGDEIIVERGSLETVSANAIRACISIGSRRTPVQDPEFSIRHLVEIALRALSPGINDPYTAAAVVDRLSASLAHAFARELPPRQFWASSGHLRVVLSQPTWESLVGAAFNQIRQSGANKPMLMIHIIDAIGRLAQHASKPRQIATLIAQLRAAVEDASLSTAQQLDREEVSTRALSAVNRLTIATRRL